MSRTQPNAAEVAEQLGDRLNSRGNVYALGGAIAFGYWGQPRGTIDVDVTVFVAPERPSECIACLVDIGCDFDAASAIQSLTEHGFLRGQGSAFDHAWVRSELEAMYGKRDPRLSQWDELVAERE